MNDLYAMIELLGAVPGIFFAAIILMRKKNHQANIILAVALILYSAQLFSLFLVRRFLPEHVEAGLIFMNAIAMLTWPLFFRYVSMIAFPSDILHRRHFIHLTPFFAYLLCALIPSLLFTSFFRLFFVIAMILTALITVTYNSLMLRVLRRLQVNSENFFSETEQLKATWIKINIYLWFALILDQIIFFMVVSSGIAIPTIWRDFHGVFVNLISIAWVYVIGYFAITHPDIFKITEQMLAVIEEEEKHKDEPLEQIVHELIVEQELSEPEETATPSLEEYTPAPEKVEHHAEPQEDHYATMAIEKIERIMRNDKPYLNNQLTIAMLASQAGIPPYLLGKIINRRLNKNFITYINEYRIEEIKRKLKDPACKNVSILEIAYESGFRSKSAFNTFFKKVTGVTPSEFRENPEQ